MVNNSINITEMNNHLYNKVKLVQIHYVYVFHRTQCLWITPSLTICPIWLVTERGCHGHMAAGCTTTDAISAYHHWRWEFESCSCGGVLDTTLCLIGTCWNVPPPHIKCG